VCRLHFRPPGVHFNWYLGVDAFKVGHPPLGPRSYTQAEYLAIATAQIGEVSALFEEDGGPFEVWFDGGPGTDALPLLSRAVMAAAPNAICHSCLANFTKGGSVRWMGNEEGSMPLPSWSAGPQIPLMSSAVDMSYNPAYNGDPRGRYFMPASSDVVLREHYWFFQNDTEQFTKTTKQLVNNYLTSVGRNSNLILNIAPDGTGAIPASDIARYAEMGAAIRCLFSRPIANTTAPLPMAADGTMTFSLPSATSSSNISLVLREDQRDGQLIGNYTLDCLSSGSSSFAPCLQIGLSDVIPRDLFPGIGHKRILVLSQNASQSLTAVRLVVQSHFATGTQVPTLRDISLYDWSGGVEACV